MSKTHTVIAGTERPVAVGARRVRDVDPNARVDVTIALKAPELPPPGKTPAKPLTPAEFVREYGADPKNIRKVEESLRSYGLQIDGVGPTGRTLRASGTAAAMESAFHAGMGIYHGPAHGEFRGREGSVSIPSDIADLVDTVIGLDQRRVVRRHVTKAATKNATKAATRKIAEAAALPTTPLTPNEIETHYNFPPGDCAGQKIAIAEFGGDMGPTPLGTEQILPPAYFRDDLVQFCQHWGRPVPLVNTVTVNLAPLNESLFASLTPEAQGVVLDPTGEVMLDIEIVATLCPAAEISVYYATWNQLGLINLFEQVFADRPVALSVSYGGPEDGPLAQWDQKALQNINAALQSAQMVGVTICVASGDDGSGCPLAGFSPNAEPAPPTDDRAHVNFPASSPYVLSVGGTMFSGQEEVVWWQWPGWRLVGGGATGGGVSTTFPRPDWQTVDVPSINPGHIPSGDTGSVAATNGSFKGRIVPDVAALAGPPCIWMWLRPEGLIGQGSGTSASAPVWASLVARINAALPPAKRQRFIAPLLYQKNVGTQGFTDIVSGDNASYPNPGKGYSAGKGFDAVTGWGVPNGKQLLSLLAAL